MSRKPLKKLRIYLRSIDRLQERITYVVVICMLLGIVKFGHATHWSFGLGHSEPNAEAKNDKPSKVDEPKLTVESKEDNKSTDAQATVQVAPAAAQKAGIETASVTREAVTQVVTAFGAVEYDHDRVAQLSVRVPGNVWRVEKQIGSIVKKGDVLAIIDAFEVGEAKSEFLQAVVAHELRQENLKRMKMVASDAISERALREADAGLREAKVRLLSTQQKLINLGLPLKLEGLTELNDEALAERIRFLGLPKSLSDTLDPVTTTANLIPLVAPFDGVVIGRAIAVGELVSPSDSHFVVADVRRVWVTVDVSKEDAPLVRLGQPLTFTADGTKTRVTGKIDWVSTELDARTRTLPVRAIIENPLIETDGVHTEQRLLKAHTFGTAQVTVRADDNALALPAAAVQLDGMRRFVFVKNGDSFVRRDVQVGVSALERYEVLDGVTEGDLVAVSGSHVLKAQLIQQGGR
jgi:cobalt-zinc-cadmium efflux system membrane fusion protein